MKYLALLFANFRRKRLRTFFTVGSIFFAFLLFGLLGAIKLAFELGVDVAGADRLILINKVALIQPLPYSYQARIEQVEGVEAATHANWFGGIYQDPKNFFGQFAVDPEGYLDLYPEILLSEEEKKAWLADRIGAVAGRATADRFGWKVGDRIPIQATFMRRKDGNDTWEFNLVGIYEGAEQGTDTTQFLFHWDYLEEARAFGEGLVGWYIVRVDDADRTAEIAEDIDTRFANSPYETRTTTEKAFVQAFASQIGDIGSIVTYVVTAVFFIILLVVGNTIAQSVRERTSELAVLKTLGFTGGRVLGLVLAESCLIALVGGGLGLALSYPLVAGVAKMLERYLPIVYLPPEHMVTGIALIFGLGLVAGLLPALQAMRLPIVEALRKA